MASAAATCRRSRDRIPKAAVCLRDNRAAFANTTEEIGRTFSSLSTLWMRTLNGRRRRRSRPSKATSFVRQEICTAHLKPLVAIDPLQSGQKVRAPGRAGRPRGQQAGDHQLAPGNFHFLAGLEKALEVEKSVPQVRPPHVTCFSITQQFPIQSGRRSKRREPHPVFGRITRTSVWRKSRSSVST